MKLGIVKEIRPDERRVAASPSTVGKLVKVGWTVLVENHAGALPLWLAPVQVVVMNVTDRQEPYVREVEGQLRGAGFRVEADLRNEKITYKIREHSIQKLPYQLVLGDKEVAARTVSARTRAGENLAPVPLEAFISRLQGEMAGRN